MVGLKQFEKYSLYSINVVSQFDQLLHFKTRLIASGVPLMIPYFSITSTEYSEQVGENLHPPPPNIYLRIGESVDLYIFNNSRICFFF